METTEKLENDTQNETNTQDNSESVISIDGLGSILTTEETLQNETTQLQENVENSDITTLIWFHKDVKQADRLELNEDVIKIPTDFSNIEELNLDKKKNYKLALVYHQTTDYRIPINFNKDLSGTECPDTIVDENGISLDDKVLSSTENLKKNILGKDLTHLLECYNIKTLDLLTCDMITLTKLDKTEIRYSLDRTGNPDNERTNWLLESHNVNIEKEYFSSTDRFTEILSVLDLGQYGPTYNDKLYNNYHKITNDWGSDFFAFTETDLGKEYFTEESAKSTEKMQQINKIFENVSKTSDLGGYFYDEPRYDENGIVKEHGNLSYHATYYDRNQPSAAGRNRRPIIKFYGLRDTSASNIILKSLTQLNNKNSEVNYRKDNQMIVSDTIEAGVLYDIQFTSDVLQWIDENGNKQNEIWIDEVFLMDLGLIQDTNNRNINKRNIAIKNFGDIGNTPENPIKFTLNKNWIGPDCSGLSHLDIFPLKISNNKDLKDKYIEIDGNGKTIIIAGKAEWDKIEDLTNANENVLPIIPLTDSSNITIRNEMKFTKKRRDGYLFSKVYNSTTSYNNKAFSYNTPLFLDSETFKVYLVKDISSIYPSGLYSSDSFKFSNAKSISYNNDVYYIGLTHSYGVRSKFCYKYESSRNTWKRLTNMRKGRAHHSICLDSTNGYIYVTGGLEQDGSYVSEVERYDIGKNIWTSIDTETSDSENHQCERLSHTSIYKDNYIYIFGGTVVDSTAPATLRNNLQNDKIKHYCMKLNVSTTNSKWEPQASLYHEYQDASGQAYFSRDIGSYEIQAFLIGNTVKLIGGFWGRTKFNEDIFNDSYNNDRITYDDITWNTETATFPNGKHVENYEKNNFKNDISENLFEEFKRYQTTNSDSTLKDLILTFTLPDTEKTLGGWNIEKINNSDNDFISYGHIHNTNANNHEILLFGGKRIDQSNTISMSSKKYYKYKYTFANDGTYIEYFKNDLINPISNLSNSYTHTSGLTGSSSSESSIKYNNIYNASSFNNFYNNIVFQGFDDSLNPSDSDYFKKVTFNKITIDVYEPDNYELYYEKLYNKEINFKDVSGFEVEIQGLNTEYYLDDFAWKKENDPLETMVGNKKPFDNFEDISSITIADICKNLLKVDYNRDTSLSTEKYFNETMTYRDTYKYITKQTKYNENDLVYFELFHPLTIKDKYLKNYSNYNSGNSFLNNKGNLKIYNDFSIADICKNICVQSQYSNVFPTPYYYIFTQDHNLTDFALTSYWGKYNILGYTRLNNNIDIIKVDNNTHLTNIEPVTYKLSKNKKYSTTIPKEKYRDISDCLTNKNIDGPFKDIEHNDNDYSHLLAVSPDGKFVYNYSLQKYNKDISDCGGGTIPKDTYYPHLTAYSVEPNSENELELVCKPEFEPFFQDRLRDAPDASFNKGLLKEVKVDAYAEMADTLHIHHPENDNTVEFRNQFWYQLKDGSHNPTGQGWNSHLDSFNNGYHKGIRTATDWSGNALQEHVIKIDGGANIKVRAKNYIQANKDQEGGAGGFFHGNTSKVLKVIVSPDGKNLYTLSMKEIYIIGAQKGYRFDLNSEFHSSANNFDTINYKRGWGGGSANKGVRQTMHPTITRNHPWTNIGRDPISQGFGLSYNKPDYSKSPGKSSEQFIDRHGNIAHDYRVPQFKGQGQIRPFYEYGVAKHTDTTNSMGGNMAESFRYVPSNTNPNTTNQLYSTPHSSEAGRFNGDGVYKLLKDISDGIITKDDARAKYCPINSKTFTNWNSSNYSKDPEYDKIKNGKSVAPYSPGLLKMYTYAGFINQYTLDASGAFKHIKEYMLGDISDGNIDLSGSVGLNGKGFDISSEEMLEELPSHFYYELNNFVPYDMKLDHSGNNLYVTGINNDRLFKFETEKIPFKQKILYDPPYGYSGLACSSYNTSYNFRNTHHQHWYVKRVVPRMYGLDLSVFNTGAQWTEGDYWSNYHKIEGTSYNATKPTQDLSGTEEIMEEVTSVWKEYGAFPSFVGTNFLKLNGTSINIYNSPIVNSSDHSSVHEPYYIGRTNTGLSTLIGTHAPDEEHIELIQLYLKEAIGEQNVDKYFPKSTNCELWHYKRDVIDSSGNLTDLDKIDYLGYDFQKHGMINHTSIAISPDDKSVYITANTDNSRRVYPKYTVKHIIETDSSTKASLNYGYMNDYLYNYKWNSDVENDSDRKGQFDYYNRSHSLNEDNDASVLLNPYSLESCVYQLNKKIDTDTNKLDKANIKKYHEFKPFLNQSIINPSRSDNSQYIYYNNHIRGHEMVRDNKTVVSNLRVDNSNNLIIINNVKNNYTFNKQYENTEYQQFSISQEGSENFGILMKLKLDDNNNLINPVVLNQQFSIYNDRAPNNYYKYPGIGSSSMSSAWGQSTTKYFYYGLRYIPIKDLVFLNNNTFISNYINKSNFPSESVDNFTYTFEYNVFNYKNSNINNKSLKDVKIGDKYFLRTWPEGKHFKFKNEYEDDSKIYYLNSNPNLTTKSNDYHNAGVDGGKYNTIIKIVDICNNETEPTFTIQNVYDGEATFREVIPQIYLTYYENFINLNDNKVIKNLYLYNSESDNNVKTYYSYLKPYNKTYYHNFKNMFLKGSTEGYKNEEIKYANRICFPGWAGVFNVDDSQTGEGLKQLTIKNFKVNIFANVQLRRHSAWLMTKRGDNGILNIDNCFVYDGLRDRVNPDSSSNNYQTEMLLPQQTGALLGAGNLNVDQSLSPVDYDNESAINGRTLSTNKLNYVFSYNDEYDNSTDQTDNLINNLDNYEALSLKIRYPGSNFQNDYFRINVIKYNNFNAGIRIKNVTDSVLYGSYVKNQTSPKFSSTDYNSKYNIDNNLLRHYVTTKKTYYPSAMLESAFITGSEDLLPSSGDLAGFDCKISGNGNIRCYSAPNRSSNKGCVHIFFKGSYLTSISKDGEKEFNEKPNNLSIQNGTKFGGLIEMNHDGSLICIGNSGASGIYIFNRTKTQPMPNGTIFEENESVGNILEDCYNCKLNHDGTIMIASNATHSNDGGIVYIFNRESNMSVESTRDVSIKWEKDSKTFTENGEKYFGKQIAINSNGDRIAIASEDNIFIYEKSGSDWSQLGNKIPKNSKNRISTDSITNIVGDEFTESEKLDPKINEISMDNCGNKIAYKNDTGYIHIIEYRIITQNEWDEEDIYIEKGEHVTSNYSDISNNKYWIDTFNNEGKDGILLDTWRSRVVISGDGNTLLASNYDLNYKNYNIDTRYSDNNVFHERTEHGSVYIYENRYITKSEFNDNLTEFSNQDIFTIKKQPTISKKIEASQELIPIHSSGTNLTNIYLREDRLISCIYKGSEGQILFYNDEYNPVFTITGLPKINYAIISPDLKYIYVVTYNSTNVFKIITLPMRAKEDLDKTEINYGNLGGINNKTFNVNTYLKYKSSTMNKITGVDITNDGKHLYIITNGYNTNNHNSYISKISLSSSTGFPSTMSVGPRLLNSSCNGLSISPDNTFALTYNTINNTVDKIDLTDNIDTGHVVRNYIVDIKNSPAGGEKASMDVSFDTRKRFIKIAKTGDFALVGGYNNNTILLIDLISNQVVRLFKDIGISSYNLQGIEIAKDNSYFLFCSTSDTTIKKILFEENFMTKLRNNRIEEQYDSTKKYWIRTNILDDYKNEYGSIYTSSSRSTKGDNFGSSISLTNDGNKILIGAPNASHSAGDNSKYGKVTIHEKETNKLLYSIIELKKSSNTWETDSNYANDIDKSTLSNYIERIYCKISYFHFSDKYTAYHSILNSSSDTDLVTKNNRYVLFKDSDDIELYNFNYKLDENTTNINNCIVKFPNVTFTMYMSPFIAYNPFFSVFSSYNTGYTQSHHNEENNIVRHSYRNISISESIVYLDANNLKSKIKPNINVDTIWKNSSTSSWGDYTPTFEDLINPVEQNNVPYFLSGTDFNEQHRLNTEFPYIYGNRNEYMSGSSANTDYNYNLYNVYEKLTGNSSSLDVYSISYPYNFGFFGWSGDFYNFAWKLQNNKIIYNHNKFYYSYNDSYKTSKVQFSNLNNYAYHNIIKSNIIKGIRNNRYTHTRLSTRASVNENWNITNDNNYVNNSYNTKSNFKFILDTLKTNEFAKGPGCYYNIFISSNRFSNTSNAKFPLVLSKNVGGQVPNQANLLGNYNSYWERRVIPQEAGVSPIDNATQEQINSKPGEYYYTKYPLVGSGGGLSLDASNHSYMEYFELFNTGLTQQQYHKDLINLDDEIENDDDGMASYAYLNNLSDENLELRKKKSIYSDSSDNIFKAINYLLYKKNINIPDVLYDQFTSEYLSEHDSRLYQNKDNFDFNNKVLVRNDASLNGLILFMKNIKDTFYDDINSDGNNVFDLSSTNLTISYRRDGSDTIMEPDGEYLFINKSDFNFSSQKSIKVRFSQTPDKLDNFFYSLQENNNVINNFFNIDISDKIVSLNEILEDVTEFRNNLYNVWPAYNIASVTPESGGNIKDQFLLWCKTSKDLDGGDITNWEQLDGYNYDPNDHDDYEIWITSKDLSDNKPYKPTGSFINSNYINGELKYEIALDSVSRANLIDISVELSYLDKKSKDSNISITNYREDISNNISSIQNLNDEFLSQTTDSKLFNSTPEMLELKKDMVILYCMIKSSYYNSTVDTKLKDFTDINPGGKSFRQYYNENN